MGREPNLTDLFEPTRRLKRTVVDLPASEQITRLIPEVPAAPLPKTLRKGARSSPPSRPRQRGPAPSKGFLRSQRRTLAQRAPLVGMGRVSAFLLMVSLGALLGLLVAGMVAGMLV